MEWWWCGRRRFGLMVFARSVEALVAREAGDPGHGIPASVRVLRWEDPGEAGRSEGVYWLEGKRMKRLMIVAAPWRWEP